MLDTLSEREAGVVSMRFGLTDGEDKTLDQIGKVYGVTRERIRQIEYKTMTKLRDHSRSAVLEPYLYDGGRRPKPEPKPRRLRIELLMQIRCGNNQLIHVHSCPALLAQCKGRSWVGRLDRRHLHRGRGESQALPLRRPRTRRTDPARHHGTRYAEAGPSCDRPRS